MSKFVDAVCKPELWVGAVLGTVVSIIFAVLWWLVRRLWERRLVRRFLGDLADEQKTLFVFMRDMQSINGKHYSVTPFGQRQEWQNFSVVARRDVESASECLNLLGQVGRGSNIVWRDSNRDFDEWSKPAICVGGNVKTEKAFELCKPAFVRCETKRFVTVADKRVFPVKEGPGGHDFGVIYRGQHPAGNSCLVLFGYGAIGTAAAGSYLRRNARYLAKLYGSQPFAAIVRVGWHDGKDSGTIAWLSPAAPLAPLLHLPAWWQRRKFMNSQPESSQDIADQPREPGIGPCSGSGPSDSSGQLTASTIESGSGPNGPADSGSTLATRRPDTGSGS